jgi:plastocyanin domain-containing protein
VEVKMKRLGTFCVLAGFALAAPLFGASPAVADEEPERTIVIKDHRFDPAVVEVPAGVRVKLVIDNRDPTAEEFESLDLRREKVVSGNSKATIWVGPLPAGEYAFVGEFNEATAQGKLIAK